MSRIFDPQPPIMSYEMPPSTCPLFFNDLPANVPSTSPANSVEDVELTKLTTSAESLSLKDSTRPCPLLLLPREIRDQIYTYLIPPSGVYRNWVPDLPRVFRRKCLQHKTCWLKGSKTCSWRGWNKVYEEEMREKGRRWAEHCKVEEGHKRTSEAMKQGLELCEGWMRESVGWNALRVRETCKQVAEEAAETIFSTATFRYRHTDFHRKSEVRYLYPSLSPLMAHGRHNIDLEIDCSRTHASQSLLHLLTILSAGPKVSCPLHPRSQVSRLKQYHAPNHPYLTDSSDYSDPSDLGIGTNDDLGASNYNPFTLSPLTYHNTKRSDYITPVALPLQFFDPRHSSTLVPADDATVPKKWYTPIRSVSAEIATATLSIAIPEGRYIPIRRKMATLAHHPTSNPRRKSHQPPHFSTAFFGPAANANDDAAVATWINAMSGGWDRLVVRCYHDTDTKARVAEGDGDGGITHDAWEEDEAPPPPPPVSLGVRALVDAVLGARRETSHHHHRHGKAREQVRCLPTAPPVAIANKGKEKEEQHPAPNWATLEVRYMTGEDEGRGCEVVLEGRREDGGMDVCVGVEWEEERVVLDDGEAEEEGEEWGEEVRMEGDWEVEGAEGSW